MSRMRIALTALGLVVITAIVLSLRTEVLAQAPAGARGDSAEATIAALLTEVRALRADMAAASRNQLRAQMLLGRVQMQEQRLAYLDKQRSEVAASIMAQGQMTTMLRNQVRGFDGNGCGNMPSAEAKRDCEGQATFLKQQLASQDAHEQQLRAQESDLANALAAEQARWSDFNARLDELERTVR
jgi:hypothetical protein